MRPSLRNLITQPGKLGLQPGGWAFQFFPVTGACTATNSPTGSLNLKGDDTNSAFADQQVSGLSIGRRYALDFYTANWEYATYTAGVSQGDGTYFSYIAPALGRTKRTFVATVTSVWVRFGDFGSTQVVISNIS